jgi:hypothetical protein
VPAADARGALGSSRSSNGVTRALLAATARRAAGALHRSLAAALVAQRPREISYIDMRYTNGFARGLARPRRRWRPRDSRRRRRPDV